MAYKYSSIKVDELSPANDTYADILYKYCLTRDGLASKVKEEFKQFGKEIIQLTNSKAAFHPNNYARTINKIISTDREMSRKILALNKIGIFI